MVYTGRKETRINVHAGIVSPEAVLDVPLKSAELCRGEDRRKDGEETSEDGKGTRRRQPEAMNRRQKDREKLETGRHEIF